ncbi:MAG: glycogen debranching protein GlgX [Okeania sp. SIO2C2]|uniref:glycogen debranching protein GlgX n=1 Tax=Okeania sp. SIO2C2 TaxID=2607787 RepID=UPI0013B68597|nr:glycogen debranching protein GlgX [Okeania sp. SIO2C2]NEP89544.1 glycogen debranching protein GlgX [Okeania sp. SIO2C2]
MQLDRIDIHPTDSHGDFKLRSGKPFPFGATLVPGGVNFSIFSSNATSCTLVLFQKGAIQPMAEIPFPEKFRIGNVYCMIVFDLNIENIEYGYRMDGPNNFQEGQWFDKNKILMDPYAKIIGGRDVWGVFPNWDDNYQHRARIAYDDFDWENDRPLEIPPEDQIIYEMHVRSFTAHPSSGVKHPGTFAAIREKIPYLKELGVNSVELMPIYEFDEFENSRPSPITGEMLYNYWGYSTVGFFAPKAGYAATGKSGMQIDELKTLIKELHKNGIEVILDVVFNHTAEGNENGPTISFRGIDNKVYYMLTPEGYYYNFSGCGNTINCNNPIVRGVVLDCLRYWASEYHIDGFRFDLASILGRDPWGAPLTNPPLLETLAFDPILANCKLIAEAWDAGGLYQVGSFPAFGRWAEWNGKYRDAIRKFIKGDCTVGEMAQRLQGSPDLYSWQGRAPATSINFITAHDGFTLADMVSYNGKHNEANGENNNDGANDNESWNCGTEGWTDDPGINALRSRQMRNAIAIMMVSQGVPMLLMGDEIGRSKHGNNNTYCHDSELNWLNWEFLKTNAELFRFVKNCIAFRKAHPVLRNRNHFRNQDYTNSGYADITWHGTQAWNVDWSESCRTIAFMLCGKHAKEGKQQDNYIYVAMNMHWESLWFEIPGLPQRMQWHVFANTACPSPEDAWEPGTEPVLENQQGLLVGDRSVVILIGK